MADERCNRCNRRLKTPEAIEAGFGSACYKKLFGKALKQHKKSSGVKFNSRNAEEQQEIEGQISLFNESEVLNDGTERNG